ncbi:pyridoxamine 5'-phosphate oxidase family protein [Nisaea nitritireducens]|uniref:pyridoxamine 5'-phosphate oxidase family protein n=1 Tax=Nisaea nitritireducens TaxID=568392 RepID=UPI00186936AC|nr:pyridoxamine 5'-phosphate oxidase family protein [Nisaea nitritireducens]
MSGRPDKDPDALALIDRASALLSAAPGNPQAAFRYPVLSTVGRDGGPNGRVLVLRAADPVTWQAALHTDSRAEKVAELAANSAAMLVFYDHEASLQLRLKGTIGRNADKATLEAIWAELPASNRPNYRASLPTGSAISAAGDGIDSASAQSGYENFDVLTFSAETADILQLARTGNRRYRLDVLSGAGTWLVP